MTAPQARFYVGFGATWKTANASIVWTEVTDKVLSARGVRVIRGRGSERDDDRAGSVALTLDNSGRDFDPEYSAGPHFGDLVAEVPLKMTATPAGGVEVDVFRGFIPGWEQEYDVSNEMAYVPIVAVDGLGKLANARTSSSVYAVEVAADAPAGWWRLTESAGSAMRDSSGNGHDGAYATGTTMLADRHPNQWETATAINFDGDYRPAVVDNVASLLTGRPVTVEFILRPERFPIGEGANGQLIVYRGQSFALTCQMYIGEDEWAFSFRVNNAAGIANNDMLSGLLERDGNAHHVAMRLPAAGSPQIYLDGVLATTSPSTLGSFAAGSRLVLAGQYSPQDASLEPYPMRGPFAEFAVYDYDLGTTRLAAHVAAMTNPWSGDTTGVRIARILDLVDWPADLRDVAAGFTNLGPAKLDRYALALLKNCERAEQGRIFISRSGKLTFLDRYFSQLETEGSVPQVVLSDVAGGGVAYSALASTFDSKQVLNVVSGSRPGGATITAFDQVSIDRHGEKPDSTLVGVQVLDDRTLEALVEQRLERYKEPSRRLKPIAVHMHAVDAATQADLLALELGYRIETERTPQGVGSAITEQTLVEGIEHQLGPDGEWTMQVLASPVDTREYATWDNGLWDAGVWAF